ncbi:MAG: hypothetical protein QOD74_2315 [Variibacter sp.]|nr:hypothetical protein [Variibacter sp.]
MRVHSFRRSGNRVTATVEWEDSARGPFDLFFESSSPDLPRDGGGEAFVLACLPIAVHHQERRLRVDAPICPFLQDRLEVLLGWWRQWHMLRAPIVIEVNQGETPLPSGDRQAYSFISGGFDSLHLLLRNRERYPLHHPRRIKRSIFGHGFDLAYRPGVPDKRFAMVLPHLQAVADDAGVELIIAESNLIMMDNDGGVWVHYLHGAALGAIAHAVIPGKAYATIASTFDIPNLKPYGTHPSTDPCFSSERILFSQWGETVTRLDKARELGRWPQALDHLTVCTDFQLDRLNCGRCEKCKRAWLELRAWGLSSSALDPAAVSPDELRVMVRETTVETETHYRNLLGPLEQQGLSDHVAVMREELAKKQSSLAH